MKIMKIIEIDLRITKNENHRNPNEYHENHENLKKIHMNHENNENYCK